MHKPSKRKINKQSKYSQTQKSPEESAASSTKSKRQDVKQIYHLSQIKALIHQLHVLL